MAAPERSDLPWVLLRRGSPPIRFISLDLARRFYDQQRFNRPVDADAAVFGPNGEAWYCRRWRSAQWERDDDRRKREAPSEDAGEAA